MKNFFGVKIANKLLTHLPNNVFKGKETLQPKLYQKKHVFSYKALKAKQNTLKYNKYRSQMYNM